MRSNYPFKKQMNILAFALPCLMTSSLSFSAEADSLESAFTEADTHISFRLRSESVDQDGKDKDALSNTLRSRLNFKTQSYKSFSAFFEFDDVEKIGGDTYNDGVANGVLDDGNRPVVKDPENTEVNQSFLAYTGLPDSTIKLGRQRILLDNQRHVGGVGWRQNEQTYDAISLLNKSLTDTEIFAAKVSEIKTITGAFDDKREDFLLNVKYKGLPWGALSGYHYVRQDVMATSGARFAGSHDLDNGKLNYLLETATQGDTGDNAAEIDVSYQRLELGFTHKKMGVLVAREVMGSEDGNVFAVPTGTNHAHNGWADKFFVGAVPPGGLQDSFIKLSAPISGLKTAFIYHVFDQNDGDLDYGSEIDLLVKKKFDKHYSGLIKYASYSKGDVATAQTDTDKLIVQFLAKY